MLPITYGAAASVKMSLLLCLNVIFLIMLENGVHFLLEKKKNLKTMSGLNTFSLIRFFSILLARSKQELTQRLIINQDIGVVIHSLF